MGKDQGSATRRPGGRALLDVQQAARVLGVSTHEIYRLLHTGVLPYQRVGGTVQIPAPAVRVLISARPRPAVRGATRR